jgi:hypothetical protein
MLLILSIFSGNHAMNVNDWTVRVSVTKDGPPTIFLLDLALLAFLQIKPLHQVVVVHKTTQAKATGRLEPCRHVARQNRGSNQRPVGATQLVTEQEPRQAQRGESQTNRPSKTFRPGRLPIGLWMKQNGK